MEDIRHIAARKLTRFELVRKIVFRRSMQGGRMHFKQMPILAYIVNHNGCRQAEIAEALGVTPSSIATSTKRLSHAGLIDKRADECDTRCNRICVTDEGLREYERATAKRAALVQRQFEGFSDAEITGLLDMIERMTENMADDDIGSLRFHELVKMEKNLEAEDGER
ncbi:MAG: MarR family transcriptional regulator [Clostridia bacterium]|nr:MarR family transcriptional regulator [Clostridia bacterium]